MTFPFGAQFTIKRVTFAEGKETVATIPAVGLITVNPSGTSLTLIAETEILSTNLQKADAGVSDTIIWQNAEWRIASVEIFKRRFYCADVLRVGNLKGA